MKVRSWEVMLGGGEIDKRRFSEIANEVRTVCVDYSVEKSE